MNFIKTALWLGIFFGMLYAGFQFATPYYRVYSFESDVKEMVRFDSKSPEDLLKLIMDKAHESGVSVAEEQIEVTGSAGSFQIKAAWNEEVNLMDQYKKKIPFSFQAP